MSSYARLLPPLVAYEKNELAELRKLTPPASLAHDWQVILGDTQKVIEFTAKLGESPQAGRTPAVRVMMLESAYAEQRMLALAKRDGFKDCARFS